MILDEDLLTTREVAELLGVGATSVKRWADSGLLGCVKTPGGHRRFPRASVDAFLALGRKELASRPGPASRSEEWLFRLSRGMSVNDIVKAMRGEYRGHGSWFGVADAMKAVIDELGNSWARGDITVIQEHIISERLARAFTRVSEKIMIPGKARTCMLTTAEGDEHTLGLHLAELCLREAGWAAIWTGRQTPIHLACEFIISNPVHMVGVSASAYSCDAARLGEQAERLERVCRQAAIPLVLGGMGAWPERPTYGHRQRRFAQFHELLEGLEHSEGQSRKSNIFS